LVMFAASFVLGPLLDHQHSRFDVLHYTHPLVLDMNIILAPILHNPLSEQFISMFSEPIGFFFVGESGTFETDWWVGPLFGVAGIIMGLGTTTLDSIFLRNGVKARRIKEIEENLQPVRTKSLISASPAKPVGGWEPSWAFTLASISFFALQYAASGMLASPDFDLLGGEGHLPYHSIDVFLLLWAAGVWAYFDKTYQGLAIAGAAAKASTLPANTSNLNISGSFYAGFTLVYEHSTRLKSNINLMRINRTEHERDHISTLFYVICVTQTHSEKVPTALGSSSLYRFVA